jgi:hypothetical protein
VALGLGLAVVALAGVLHAGWLELALSDQSTVDLLSAASPATMRLGAGILGFALGAALVGVAWRAWGWVLAATAAVVVAWMALGEPALERAMSARDSLRPFAQAVGARYPEPAPLAFHPETIRSVALYAGRRIPTLARRRDLPGHLVIAPEDSYRSLVDDAVLGPPIAVAAGRVGNLRRSRVVLAEAPNR